MSHIDSTRPLPGFEVQGPMHIRLLTVVPTDLKALLEKLEADAKADSETENETK